MDSGVFLLLEDHMHYCHYPEAHWALSPSTSLSLIPGSHRTFHCLQSFQFSIFPPCCHCCYAGKAVLQREQFRGEPHPRDSGTVYIKIRPIDRSKAQLLFSVWSKDSSLLAGFGDRPFPVSETHSIEDSTTCPPRP